MKPRNILRIVPKNDEEWLALKDGNIGGSTLAAILGLNEYQSPYQTWLIITGQKQFPELTPVMERGKFLEAGYANMWAYDNGHILLRNSEKNILYVDKEYPFLVVTPDRRFYYRGDKKDVRTAEVKTTFKRLEKPDDAWIIQLQWEMGFTGDKMGEIVWEFMDPRIIYKSLEIEFDTDLFSQLKSMAIDWYQEYVVGMKEPPLTTASDVLNKFPSEEPGKIIEASDALANIHSEMKSAQDKVKSDTEILDKCKEQFQLTMLDAEKVMYMGQTLCTWKVNKNGSRVFRIC